METRGRRVDRPSHQAGQLGAELERHVGDAPFIKLARDLEMIRDAAK